MKGKCSSEEVSPFSLARLFESVKYADGALNTNKCAKNQNYSLFTLHSSLFFVPLHTIIKEVIVKDERLQQAAMEGMDAFVKVFVDAIREAIGGELTAETIGELNSDQITLLAWDMLHEEVMDGGFVQLIHNGLGEFIFKNPFAKAVKLWGMRDLSKLIYEGHTLWLKYREEIEKDCTEEEFMALFERFPEFDDLDDQFVENEEEWMDDIAHYIDDNLEKFVTIQ